MRVLVLGGGGREHALCWALARSESVDEVLCAPGNAGAASVATLLEADPTDVALIRELAVREAVDLVVVGPEAPLVAGVADTLAVAGVPVFGPTRSAAAIESSKTFAKETMTAAGVPTAAYWSGSDPAAARAALRGFAPPYVVKADGLAAGKGVRVCADVAEAWAAIDDMLVGGRFGAAGESVVIEEFLDGPELSVFAVCGGGAHVIIGAARDYKRALDGDAGPNTGGMGSFTPVPAFTDQLRKQVDETVLAPVLAELRSRGLPYRGVLYAGLVLTAQGPKVLEFNARFGDPEAQALLPCLPGDLGALLAAAAGDDAAFVEHSRRIRRECSTNLACVAVVLASGGYPGAYETGRRITGLDEAAAVPGALVFHAGIRREGRHLVTAGGRVLAVSGLGPTVADARAAAYAAADRIHFEGLHRRGDIAAGVT
ncbi:MAG: phosphoribosylamine--glycine ligase [Egibacteraceae bacterium]